MISVQQRASYHGENILSLYEPINTLLLSTFQINPLKQNNAIKLMIFMS